MVYRPLFSRENESKMVNTSELKNLYAELPCFCKATDPKIVYSFEQDGRSFSRLLFKIHEYSGCPLILMLKSNKNSVFGAFFDNEFEKHTSKFIGSADNFVFKIHPEFKIFKTDD